MVRPTSTYAIAGFILTVLWGFGFLSLVGLFFCAHAWRTETGKGLKGGHGFSVAGVIIGTPGTLLLVLWFLGWVSSQFSGT